MRVFLFSFFVSAVLQKKPSAKELDAFYPLEPVADTLQDLNEEVERLQWALKDYHSIQSMKSAQSMVESQSSLIEDEDEEIEKPQLVEEKDGCADPSTGPPTPVTTLTSSGGLSGTATQSGISVQGSGPSFWRRTDKSRPFLMREGQSFTADCDLEDYLQTVWAIYGGQLARASVDATYSIPEQEFTTEDRMQTVWTPTGGDDPKAITMPGTFYPRPTAVPKEMTDAPSLKQKIEFMVGQMRQPGYESSYAKTQAELAEAAQRTTWANHETKLMKEAHQYNTNRFALGNWVDAIHEGKIDLYDNFLELQEQSLKTNKEMRDNLGQFVSSIDENNLVPSQRLAEIPAPTAPKAQHDELGDDVVHLNYQSDPAWMTTELTPDSEGAGLLAQRNMNDEQAAKALKDLEQSRHKSLSQLKAKLKYELKDWYNSENA